MPARDTIVIGVHGANQGKEEGNDSKSDHQVWETCFALGKDASHRLLPTLDGSRNAAIAQHHAAGHGTNPFPQYVGWKSAWYGEIWRELTKDTKAKKVFSHRLNASSSYDRKARRSLLNALERLVMKTAFDELVSFYELAVIGADQESPHAGKTLYEVICARVLEQIREFTEGGQTDFVLLAHSMGCAVCYNVLSHLSAAKEGRPLVAIAGALSDSYASQVKALANGQGRCLGLVTFGNYTGYNWCQRLNHQILHGELKLRLRYPEYCGRWYNFYTVGDGDPFIFDDKLANSMEGDPEGAFQDMRVWRRPGNNIGHGRRNWFLRTEFVAGVQDVLETRLYWPEEAD